MRRRLRLRARLRPLLAAYRKYLDDGLALVGVAVICIGLAQLAPWTAWVLAGVYLVVVATQPPSRPRR